VGGLLLRFLIKKTAPPAVRLEPELQAIGHGFKVKFKIGGFTIFDLHDNLSPSVNSHKKDILELKVQVSVNDCAELLTTRQL